MLTAAIFKKGGCECWISSNIIYEIGMPEIFIDERFM